MDEIFKYINSQGKSLAKLVGELVSVPTVNPPGDNYPAMVRLLETKCAKLGLKTRRIKVTRAQDRICLLADWNTGFDKTLHINGHYDVVPCTNNWSMDPFKPVIKNNRVYGRGTEDMKGTIASFLMAVEALRKCRLKPKTNLQFSFTPDEETGGVTGFGYLAKNKLIKADFGIGEGYSGECVSYGNKGALWLKVKVKGKSAHASRPYKGINSFERMTQVAQELMKLEKNISRRKTAHRTRDEKDRYSTMALGGQSWGGEKVNIIPDISGFTIDRRFLPEENVKDVKNEIYECISKTGKRVNNLKVDVETLLEQSSAVSSLENNLKASFSSAIDKALKKKANFAIMAGATDMRYLINQGVPCFGYSAEGGMRWHADDEYVSIDSMVNTAKVFAYIFTNFRG